MIKAEVETRNGKKGVDLIIRGNNEEIFNELRALYSKIISDDNLYKIANNALESVKLDMLIKNYKENK